MDQIIQLLFYVVLFAVVAYGAWWLCEKFKMPQPVYWIVGALLLICLLMYISQQVGMAPMLRR